MTDENLNVVSNDASLTDVNNNIGSAEQEAVQAQDNTSNDRATESVSPQETESPAQSNDNIDHNLNAKLKSARLEGLERGRREVIEQLKQYAASQKEQQDAMADDRIRERLRWQELNRENQIIESSKKTANEILTKISAAKELYPDIEDKVVHDNVLPLGDPAIAKIATMANTLENTAEILYELKKDSRTLRNLRRDIQDGLEDAVMGDLIKLSNSIKTNNQGRARPQSRKTLDHLTQTRAGSGKGNMTSDDILKTMFSND